jgi:hypothetical protein
MESITISDFSSDSENLELLQYDVIVSKDLIRIGGGTLLKPFTIIIADNLLLEDNVQGENLILFGQSSVVIRGDVNISAQVFTKGSIDIS